MILINTVYTISYNSIVLYNENRTGFALVIGFPYLKSLAKSRLLYSSTIKKTYTYTVL